MLFTPPGRLSMSLLLSDIDECALDDNNCTKGGANCTNTVGSFNCTCQTKSFWNGIECEGLFSVPLSCSRRMSFYGVSLIKFFNRLEKIGRLAVFLVVRAFIFSSVCCVSICLSFCILLWNVGIGHFRVLGLRWSGAEIILQRENEAKCEVALIGIQN